MTLKMISNVFSCVSIVENVVILVIWKKRKMEISNAQNPASISLGSEMSNKEKKIIFDLIILALGCISLAFYRNSINLGLTVFFLGLYVQSAYFEK